MDTVVVEVPVEAGQTVGTVSATSWGAILGGAFLIAALALLLLALGAGFGLSTVSPWPGAGVSATAFGVMTVVWFVVVQWLSSGIGGYVAGRLRTRRTGLHTDEVYFRDTAHGVLAWAVAAVFSAALLAGAAAALVGAVSTVASGAAQGAAQTSAVTVPYPDVVDALFRTERADTAVGQDPRPEASRLIAAGLRPGATASAADRSYLVRLVAARTGISQDDAEKRVDDAIAQARQAADTARKAARNLALVTGFSMLIGAFIAGVAARVGGHHRDELSLA
jgi:hypothetical protein